MDKPATMLVIQISYGHEITSKRLKMVEKAEEYLKEGGLKDVELDVRFLQE